jgi:hypothetical protein
MYNTVRAAQCVPKSKNEKLGTSVENKKCQGSVPKCEKQEIRYTDMEEKSRGSVPKSPKKKLGTSSG